MGVKVREIREMGEFIRSISNKTRRAAARALLATTVAATTEAKRNAKTAFRGTAGRPRTGNLSNAIFAGFSMTGQGSDRRIASALVGVRARKGDAGTRPYGRIQEYGGVIVPKKAKNLWIPQTGPKTSGVPGRFKNITPRDFMALMKRSKRAGGAPVGFNYKGSARRKKGFLAARRPTKTADVEPVILDGAAGLFVRRGKGRTARGLFVALFVLKKRVELQPRPYVTPAVEAEFPKFGARFAAELAKFGLAPDGGPLPRES